MKTFITYLLRRALPLFGGILLVSSPSAYPAGANSAKGCVVYKGAKHGLAVLDEYLSYEMFGTVINFTDQTGTKFRVYHGENPILIPYANDLEAKSETAGKGLARAMESAPHLRRKLDVIKQAWLNRNAAEQAAKVKLASSPKGNPKSAPLKPAISPLKTKSGEEFREWSVSAIAEKKVVIQHADGSTSVLIDDIVSENLGQDPVVKKLINEGTEKEAKGDMQGALAIYTQFGLKEAVLRVTKKLAHEKETNGGMQDALAIYTQLGLTKDVLRVAEKLAREREANGDLKAAREFYSQINSGKDVARLTVQIDEQEQKMRAEEALLHQVKVIQVHKDGVIGIVIAGKKLDSLIFIAGIQREVVDDEIWAGPLVEAGTYQYETINRAAKTIRSYRVFKK